MTGAIIRHALIAVWLGVFYWIATTQFAGKVLIWTCDANVQPHRQDVQI